MPGQGEMERSTSQGRAIGLGLRARLGSQLRGKWFVAIRCALDGRIEALENMDGFRIVNPPPGHSYADPFLLEWKGRHYLFFEDYSVSTGRGRIVYCEVYPDASTSAPAVALEQEYHLSYPFLLIDAGELYMIPEMRAGGRLELFHAPAFPGEFVSAGVLIEDPMMVDPTIVRWQGRLWLFGAEMADDGDFRTRLNLFWSGGLTGPWQAHPENPVVEDVATARPAGSIVRLPEGLVRPSQDCSSRYGGALVFNRIDRMDLTEYRETAIGRIGPGWLVDNLATHTYNRDGDFEVVDGQWLTSDRRWFDLSVKTASRFLQLPTASAVRGRASWHSTS